MVSFSIKIHAGSMLLEIILITIEDRGRGDTDNRQFVGYQISNISFVFHQEEIFEYTTYFFRHDFKQSRCGAAPTFLTIWLKF